MKLGLLLGYSGAQISVPVDFVQEAERLGYDACFTAEAYGSDAVTPLAWIGAQTTTIKLGTAICQAPARSPAMCAMTAMTLDSLSGGRFMLGVGPSGPQVIEGWHGVPYNPSLTRIKEYVSIVRDIVRREAPVSYDGEVYQLPYQGPGATGVGKPLKSILHGRADMKIYTAAITPGGIRTAAEVADGFFPIWTDPERFDLFDKPLDEGFAKRSDGMTREAFDIMPFVNVEMGDDLGACFDRLRPEVALYVGGMGSRKKNFYNDFVSKLGFADAAREVQRLYLSGNKAEAAAAVPDALIDAVALCGPKDRLRDRLERWRLSEASMICVRVKDVDTLRSLAELNDA